MSGVDFRSIYSNERAGDYLEFLEILSAPLPNDAIMIQESKLCQGKGCAVFLLIQPDSLCIFSQKGPQSLPGIRETFRGDGYRRAEFRGKYRHPVFINESLKLLYFFCEFFCSLCIKRVFGLIEAKQERL